VNEVFGEFRGLI